MLLESDSEAATAGGSALGLPSKSRPLNGSGTGAVSGSGGVVDSALAEVAGGAPIGALKLLAYPCALHAARVIDSAIPSAHMFNLPNTFTTEDPGMILGRKLSGSVS